MTRQQERAWQRRNAKELKPGYPRSKPLSIMKYPGFFSKKYSPNGKQEVARRLRQAGAA